MSSQDNGSAGFLNAIMPLASLFVLNALGIGLLLSNWEHLTPGLLLGEIALIAITMTYFFLRAAMSPSGGEQARPPFPDLTKTLEVGARLDQIVADIAHLRRSGGVVDLDPIREELSALQQQVASVLSMQDEIARVNDELGRLQSLSAEVARLKDLVVVCDVLKKGQETDESERQDMVRGLEAQIAALQGRVDGADAREAVAEVRDEVEGLKGSLEGMAKASDLTALHESIVPKIQEMDEAIEGMADSNKVDKLAIEIDKIKERLAASAQAKDVQTLAADVKKQIAALSADVDQTDALQAVEEIRTALHAELDALKEQQTGAVGKEDLAAASERIDADVAQLNVRLAGFSASAVQEQLARLDAEIVGLREAVASVDAASDVWDALEQLRETAASAEDVSALRDGVAELKQSLADAAGQDDVQDAFAALRQEIDDLQKRLAEMPDAATADDVSSLRGEIEARGQGLTADDVEQKIETALADLREEIGREDRRRADEGKIGREQIASIEELRKDMASLRKTFADRLKTLEVGLSAMAKAKEELSAHMADLGKGLAEGADAGEQMRDRMEKLTVELSSQSEQKTEGAEELRGTLETLSDRLSRLADGVQRKFETSQKSFDAALDAVREEMDTVRQGLDEVVEEGKKSGKIAEEVATLREALGSTKQMRKDLGEAKEAIGAIEEEMGDLRESISRVEAAPPKIDEAGLRQEIEAAIAGLRDEIGKAAEVAGSAADSAKVEDLSERLAQLQGRLDGAQETLETVEGLTAGEKEIYQRLAELQREVAGLAGLQQSMEAMAARLGQLDGLSPQLEALGKDLQDRPHAEAIEEALDNIRGEQKRLSKAFDGVSAMDGRLAELSVQVTDSAAGVAGQIEEIKQQIAEVRSQAEAVEVVGDLKRQLSEMDAEIKRFDAAAKGAVTCEEIESVRQETAAAIEKLNASLEESGRLAVEKLEASIAETRGSMDAMKEGLKAIPEFGLLRALVEGLKREMKEFQGGTVEALSRADGRITQVSEKLSREIVGMRQKIDAAADTSAEADAISEEIRLLRAGLSVLENFAEEVSPQGEAEAEAGTATATAERAALTINVLKSQLMRTEDGSLVECVLRIVNPSDAPIEVAAVKAELDSGKTRMTPTVNKYWLPAGVEADRDRKLALPMKVLDRSTSEQVRYTVVGWPLERAMDSYGFKITLKDGHGTEHTTTVQLEPPK